VTNPNTTSNPDERLPADEPEHPQPSEWLDLYGDYLFRIALMRVKSREAAEDLVQEALLAGFKAFDSFEGRSTVKTWLTRILKNKSIDYLRKQSRSEKPGVEEITEGFVDSHFYSSGIWSTVLPDWGRSPDKSLEDREFFGVLQECIQKLPDRSRMIVLTQTLDQVESADICKELEISPSNLWVILHRARLAIRDCLDKNWTNKS
jgi:RNA polymerase sigma-70 factor (ECF subfamily)